MIKKRNNISRHTKFALIITAISFFSYFSVYKNSGINDTLQLIFGKTLLLTFDNPPNYHFIKYSTIQFVKLITIAYSILILPNIFRLKLNKEDKVKFISGAFLLVFSILWVVLSVILVGKISMTVLTPIYWTSLFFIFYSVPSCDQILFRNYILKILMVFIIVNTILIIFQFFQVKILYSKSLVESLRFVRPEGLSYDAVLASCICILSLPIIIVSDYSKINKIVISLLVVLAGFLTGARTFYILFFIYSIYYFILFNKNKGRLKFAFISSILLIISLIIFKDFINGILNLMTNIQDNNIRIQKSIFALELFSDNVFAGIGPEQYQIYEQLYFGTGTNPHNIYLQILSESGLVGFIPFLLFTINVLYNKIHYKDWNSFIIIILTLILGLVIGIFYSVPIMLIFIIASSSNVFNRGH